MLKETIEPDLQHLGEGVQHTEIYVEGNVSTPKNATKSAKSTTESMPNIRLKIRQIYENSGVFRRSVYNKHENRCE